MNGAKRKKVAFVVVRYGQDINGGAEYHCRMLAERLVEDYDVEVLTTCVKNYVTGGDELQEGEEVLNGVLIRRFSTDPIHKEWINKYAKAAKPAKKVRRFLYQCRLLVPLSYIFPLWTYKCEAELGVLNSQLFYSSKLFNFIKNHKAEYQVFIALSLDYPLMYYTVLYAGEKAVLIPTMHYYGTSFRSILTFVFSKVAYIAFNTEAEQRLAKGIIGKPIAPHGIVSVGIEEPEAAGWEETREKYQLPNEYLLYIGRVESGKLNNVVKYFLEYKKKYKDSNLRFVLVGGLFGETIAHPDIIYTGFVSEGEKMTILQHAKVFINPSKYESLSLILLEAMSQQKAMLVNGRCAVLKEHCKKSGYAALYYNWEWDFISKLRRLETSDALRAQMGAKGVRYVKENYSWPVIMGRLKHVIENI